MICYDCNKRILFVNESINVSGDLFHRECALKVTRSDGTVGRDDYDPHAEDPSDWSYGKTTEEILREMEEWAYHTRGF